MNMPLLKSQATAAMPAPRAAPATPGTVLRLTLPKASFASKLGPRLNAVAARVLPLLAAGRDASLADQNLE
jgi:hypothetical protein